MSTEIAVASQFTDFKIWTYGYNSKLQDRDSIISFFDYADSFKQHLRTLRQKTGADKRGVPMVFVAHSLGGLIWQDAIIQMNKSANERDRLNLKAIYGALCFGVPSRGMDVTALAAMVENLPSSYTLSLLDRTVGHQLRNRRQADFCEAFCFRDSKVVQFYETKKSPAVRQETGSDKWTLSGAKSPLVEPESAFCGREWESTSEYRIPMNLDHKNLVKFSEADRDEYDRVLCILHDFAQYAVKTIELRFSSDVDAEVTAEAFDIPELRQEDENKCLQLFTLVKGTENESYEWYKDRIEPRASGTCRWFLDHSHYRNWLSSDSGPLFVSADPGCGKSVLAKDFIKHELSRYGAVCYFFFKD